jgi:hypothetical protein
LLLKVMRYKPKLRFRKKAIYCLTRGCHLVM